MKCAGAPQKIMWLFEENIRKRNLREKSDVELFSSGSKLFGIKKYADMLEQLRVERGVEVYYQMELVKVNAKNKVATFKNLKDGSLMNEQYDILHVVPPMCTPDFLKNSSLIDKSGYVDVDQYTMQHKKYPDIFALGDCCNSPNSKTAAAIMAQAPVVVHNMKKLIKGEELDGVYNGYGSCPLMVSYPTQSYLYFCLIFSIFSIPFYSLLSSTFNFPIRKSFFFNISFSSLFPFFLSHS